MSNAYGSLPVAEGRAVTLEWFPTKMQAFIFRAWEFVPASKIADVLGTSEENVIKQAEKMGLYKQYLTDEWQKRGYITIIKSLWHILPYSQILQVLDRDEEWLSKALIEEDFLRCKLSPDDKKPVCEAVVYEDLDDRQEEQTRLIKRAMDRIKAWDYKTLPFDWFEKKTAAVEKPSARGVRITGGWSISDKTGFKNTGFFVQNFKRHIKEQYGAEIGSGDENAVIELVSDCHLSKPEEYKIMVTPHRITVASGEEAGILRALYCMEDEFSKNGCTVLGFEQKHKYAKIRTRFLFPYCGLYNNSFDTDSTSYCPDELLEQYARVGVNGLWFHVPMYSIAEFTFDPSRSEGYEKRLERLRELTVRSSRYGIKVYLYVNEPRAMPHEFFEKYPELKGSETQNLACLCTSVDAVKEYIDKSIYSITKSVPLLGGYFVIGVSENQTNCYWDKKGTACPKCKDRNPREVVCEVYNIISRAAHRANSDIEVIGWTWSWGMDGFPYGYRNDSGDEDVEDFVNRLDSDIIVMSCKEEIQEFEIDGFKNQVHDYTMAIEGPSEMAKKVWRAARKNGARLAAKTQINCTWECSTVPYLPVFELVCRDVENIISEGVDTIMLGWSLGGYPSPNIELASTRFFCDAEGGEDSADEFYMRKFGEYADTVKRAVKLFGEGMERFPFDWHTLYYGPQNQGVSNPLFIKPTGLEATMTCFAFDDVSLWNTVFPYEVFKNCFREMSEKWEQGIKLLEDMPDCEFKDVAYVGYTLFKSSYNQIMFVEKRGESCPELVDIVKSEREMALRVFEIMSRNPTIGYEAANHYYYSRNAIAEKIINCEYTEEYLSINAQH